MRELGLAKIRGPLPVGLRLDHWQLHLLLGVDLRGERAQGPPASAPPVTWQVPGQLPLFSARPDFTRFDRARHTNLDNPTLIHALAVLEEICQTRGWSRYLRKEIVRALKVLLSGQAPGDIVLFSGVVQVDKLGHNVSRTAEVLHELGLLHDDRADTLGDWLERRVRQLASGIADDVRAWTHELRHGSPRRQPRKEGTVRTYVMAAHPVLLTWSATRTTLREITSDDAHTALSGMTGSHRRRTAVALRSLFRFCKRTHRIFRDPTVRLSGGPSNPSLPVPLPDQLLAEAARRATTPAARLVLALTAIHAARPTTLRHLLLDDVDLANRKITINGHTRLLDELTAHLIAEHLTHRRDRWPHTLNPHLFLSEQSGHDQKPMTEWWFNKQLRGLGITINQIRMDRQLEEASHTDPTHSISAQSSASVKPQLSGTPTRPDTY